MDKKYLVVGGYVTPMNNGDRHFVSARELIALYGVKEKECRILYSEESLNYEKAVENAEKEGLTILYPRYDGDYSIANLSRDRGGVREEPHTYTKFQDWLNELMNEMTRMHESVGFRRNSPPMIEAMIPYRLGYSPRRAARAYLGIDPGTFHIMVKNDTTTIQYSKDREEERKWKDSKDGV
jgi:hypothetical protein